MEGYVLNLPCRVLFVEEESRYRAIRLHSLDPFYWDPAKVEAEVTSYKESLGKNSSTFLQNPIPGLLYRNPVTWLECTLITVNPDKKALVHVHTYQRLVEVDLHHIKYETPTD